MGADKWLVLIQIEAADADIPGSHPQALNHCQLLLGMTPVPYEGRWEGKRRFIRQGPLFRFL